MDSSYKKNNYGDLFYALTKVHNPSLVVELGVFEGYSALHIGKALKKDSDLYLIDLWDRYVYRHCSMCIATENLKELICKCYFIQEDALNLYSADKFEDDTIDMLHIDMSNDGCLLKKCFDCWYRKVKSGGLILFEGGSKERDNVDWMKKYNKTPIVDFITQGLWFGPGRSIDSTFTIKPFPSLTISRKL